MIWLSKFYPGLAVTDINAAVTWTKSHAVWAWPAWLALASAFFLLARWPRVSRALVAGLSGLLGMVGESVLLVRYQITSGVLYQDLGLLLTLFMGGLVSGSYITYFLAEKVWPSRPVPKTFIAAVIAVWCALNLALATSPPTGETSAMTVVGAALVITGILAASLFAYASLNASSGASNAVSSLYAADLWGGCLGSLAASIVLIPLVGISGTFVGMAAVAMSGLALLLRRPRV
jgi:hypothetical protein